MNVIQKPVLGGKITRILDSRILYTDRVLVLTFERFLKIL